MKDLLLGAFTGYDYNQIKYWVNSIKQSGFTGDVVVVVGNATFQTVEQLAQNGVKCICFEKDDENHMFRYNSSAPIHTERFFHFWNFLKDNWGNYRVIFTTDMKDVVFQTNPSEWWDNNHDPLHHHHILATTECLLYKHEPWGRQNLEQTFGPYFYETFKNWEIANVGVIAGRSSWMKDLCLQIFQTAINRPIAICEQACYNYLIHTKPWQEFIYMAPMYASFAANLGTVMDPSKIEQFRPNLLETEPKWDSINNQLKTNDGKLFSIIHQYDRVPQLKQFFEQKYG